MSDRLRRLSSSLASLRLLRVFLRQYASSPRLAIGDDGSPKSITHSRTGPYNAGEVEGA
jgi:hypothetical protein